MKVYHDQDPTLQEPHAEVYHFLGGVMTVLEHVHDPRRIHPSTLHPLPNILVITLLAVICGANNFCEVEQWGISNKTWLRSFLSLEHDIPSHDTFSRVFSLLLPDVLHQAFSLFTERLTKLAQGEIVSLDGKTIRATRNKEESAIHLLSAYATQQGLCLGQMRVPDHDNEIVALPVLLDALRLKGCTITVDAMGCQRSLATKAQEQGLNYIFAVKKNQPALLEEIKGYFEWSLGSGRTLEDNVQIDKNENTDKAHGRIEVRRLWCSEQVEGLSRLQEFTGARTLIQVERVRYMEEKESVEQAWYISSLRGTGKDAARHLNEAIRSHWEIENKVHWVLDVAMNEDSNRSRKDYGAENLALFRKWSLNLLRQEKSVKVGIKAKQFRANADHAYLLKVLVGA